MLCSKRGATLIEILISIFIVALASIATLTYFAYAKGGIGKTGNRRAALERARQRLEQLMETNPTLISPANDVLHQLACSGLPCTWIFDGPAETVDVEDIGQQPIVTTVRWRDDPSAGTPASTHDVLELSAKVWFTPGDTTDDDFHRVHVRTLRTP